MLTLPQKTQPGHLSAIPESSSRRNFFDSEFLLAISRFWRWLFTTGSESLYVILGYPSRITEFTGGVGEPTGLPEQQHPLSMMEEHDGQLESEHTVPSTIRNLYRAQQMSTVENSYRAH